MHSKHSKIKATPVALLGTLKRLHVLTVVVAVLAGCMLAIPVAAEEQPTPVPPAVVERNVAKFLETNAQAIQSATVLAPASFSGDLVALHRVTVTVDGASHVVCMESGNAVTHAIEAAGVTLSPADYLNMESSRFVTDGMSLQVTRVVHEEYQKTFSIAYTTETQYSAEMRQGTQKVIQAGEKGVKTVTYQNRLENGKVVETKTIKTEITKQPVKRIVVKGTKVGSVVSEAPTAVPVDSLGQPLQYKKKLTGKATAYTADRGDSGSRTSLGQPTRVGVVAVNPKVIPYGTKLWIVSPDGKFVYGYAVAGDTGGALMSGKVLVDLYYDTYAECSRFGRRVMNVYIL